MTEIGSHTRSRHGRQCPSPPHSSTSSTVDRHEDFLSALAIHSDPIAQDILIDDVDEDYALFQATTQMLSSPYHQLKSLIDASSRDSSFVAAANGTYRSPSQSPDQGAFQDSPPAPSDDIGMTRSNSDISTILCLLCYGPVGDCEDWCAGTDLLEMMDRHARTHPCDISHDIEVHTCNDPLKQSNTNLEVAGHDSDHSKDMSLDMDPSLSFASARSGSNESLEAELNRAQTPSSPSPGPRTADDSWRGLMSRCKHGSSGDKHWCEQLKQHWYDTCEDAHCEPCMDAFFMSGLGDGKLRYAGESSPSRNAAKTGNAAADKARGPITRKASKRNSFAMKLAEVQKAQSNVLSVKSSNKVVTCKQVDSTATKSDVERVWAKGGRAGTLASASVVHCGSAPPFANSRKSMILRKRTIPVPSGVPMMPSMACTKVNRRTSPTIRRKVSPAPKRRSSPRLNKAGLSKGVMPRLRQSPRRVAAAATRSTSEQTHNRADLR